METSTVEAGLRAWAMGLYPTEAAVELLIRGFGARGPWVQPAEDGSRFYLDTDLLLSEGVEGPYSGGERRVLAVVASLLGVAPVDLSEALPGLDREKVALVLAAVAHAAGSHEHSNIVIDHESGVAYNHGRHPSLYPWPEVS